jgi:hypothetical protein
MKFSIFHQPFSFFKRSIFICASLGMLALIFFIVSLYFSYKDIPQQFGVVITQKQFTIVSLLNRREPFIRSVIFDNNVEIDGVHGVGTYSISALKKLGETDGYGLSLLQDSLEEAVAYPIGHAIDIDDDLIPMKDDEPDAQSYISNQFNFLSVLMNIFQHRKRLPIELELAIYRVVSQIPKRNHLVYVVDSKTKQLVTPKDVRDGSISYTFDTSLFDQAVTLNFEDAHIRNEQVTASIYNTTSISGLGKRMERYLVHLGVQVLDVATQTGDHPSCIVLKKNETIFPYTSLFLKSTFNCLFDGSKAESSTNDISIFVGNEYAKRFEPKKYID